MNSTKREVPHVYKRALVTLIDILGFTNLITTATAEDIYTALRKKDHIAGPTLFSRSFAKQYNYLFSDLIVTAQFFRQRVKPAEVELSFFASVAEHLRLVGYQQFRLGLPGDIRTWWYRIGRYLRRQEHYFWTSLNSRISSRKTNRKVSNRHIRWRADYGIRTKGKAF